MVFVCYARKPLAAIQNRSRGFRGFCVLLSLEAPRSLDLSKTAYGAHYPAEEVRFFLFFTITALERLR